jgi:hypothetical protein
VEHYDNYRSDEGLISLMSPPRREHSRGKVREESVIPSKTAEATLSLVVIVVAVQPNVT